MGEEKFIVNFFYSIAIFLSTCCPNLQPPFAKAAAVERRGGKIINMSYMFLDESEIL